MEREAVESPSLEVFRMCVDVALRDLAWRWDSLVILRVFPNLSDSDRQEKP